jgi:glycerate kinase
MAAVSHSAQGDGARSCGVANPSMKKIVIAPDSFKGSLAAIDVARAIAAGLHRVWPAAACVLVPMADGGEGTLDAVLSAGGERRQTEVRGAAGNLHAAAFGIVEREGRPLAIIEIAQVVGITEPSGMAAPVGARSTQGVGELMRHLLDLGVRDFLIGLGGSSTNDGGAGLLTGLGARLVGEGRREIPPQPDALARVRQVDVSALDSRLAACRITIMSDVNNPLTGPRGATAIFGPQKGVTPDSQQRYDNAIAGFARLAEDALGRRTADNPGAGAAGGLGFALQLLGGEFRSGAEVIADLLRLDDALAGADWLITGEGRSDMQTMLGKTPQVVARRAAMQGVPATLLSGGIDRAALPALGETFAGCFSLVFGPMTLADAIADSTGLLADSAEQMARLLQSAWRSRAMTRA